MHESRSQYRLHDCQAPEGALVSVEDTHGAHLAPEQQDLITPSRI